jgi:tight adherence protein B
MSSISLVLAFASGFLVVVGLNLLISDAVEDRRRQIRKRLEEDSRLRQQERARNSMTHRELYEMAAEQFVDPESQITAIERLRRFVGQSGSRLRAEQVMVISLILVVTCGGGLGVLAGNLALGVFSGICAGATPFLVVGHLRGRRRNQLASQLPDAFEMMARVLRSGQTISQAMRGVAEEFSSPLAEEFAFCWEQQNLGLSPEASLKELARRTGLLEIKIFVVALMIHRQAGGNLSSLLSKLSSVIREREKIRGKIAALTAEGKFQAYILAGLPFAVGVAISLLNPGYISQLFQYPRLIVAMLAFEIAGILWMRRIIDFEF